MISFLYRGQEKEETRIVEPLQLVFKSQAWYLYGFCRGKQDFRFFKLSRIRDLQPVEEGIEAGDYPLLSQEKLELLLNPSKDKVEGNKEEIELIFEESALPKIYDHFTEEEITVEQTRIKVHAFRALTPVFFELILSFAQQVKVISPKKLQGKLIHTLQKNLQQYDRL